MECGYAPYNWTQPDDSNGAVQIKDSPDYAYGYDVMMAKHIAEELGMDALVEAHDAKEVERALKSGARIIGVNNRDLRTFEVDMANSINLRKLAPENVIFVSESGIRTSEDIQRLHDNKIEAVLIGETLMRSPDKKAALEELNGAPLAED